MCMLIITYIWKDTVCAYVRINACIHIFFCTCVYGYIYVCLHVCERTVGCIQKQRVCIQIHVYISGFVLVCMCVHLYIYVWKGTVCACRGCSYKYKHKCLCLYLVYGCVLYVCVGIYPYTCIHERHHACIQIHCVRIGIHSYVSVFVRVGVCTHMYTYIYKKTQCAHTKLIVCVCIYARRLHMWVCRCFNVCMSV